MCASMRACMRVCVRVLYTSIVYIIQVFYILQSYCLSESRKAPTQSYFTLDLMSVVSYGLRRIPGVYCFFTVYLL